MELVLLIYTKSGNSLDRNSHHQQTKVAKLG
jgi:hypothetical protein